MWMAWHTRHRGRWRNAEASASAEESADEDEPSAKRQRTPPFGAWLAGIERRVRYVNYQGQQVKAAGSKFVEAHLGPGSFMPRANDANAKLPSGIKAARKKYRSATSRPGTC